MADVYISYARDDQHWAEQIGAALTQSGWKIEWDQITQPLSPQSDHRRLIRAARCVVVLWSHSSTQSRFVRAEAIEADNRNVLVAVRVEDITLPLEFLEFTVSNLTHWSGSLDDPEFRKLTEAVRVHVSPSRSASTRTANDDRPADSTETEQRQHLSSGHVVITILAPADGTIRWLMKAGSSVQRGDRVAVIDKEGAITHLSAPDAGALEDKFVADGVRVERRQPVALIRQVPPVTPLDFGRSPQSAVAPEVPIVAANRQALFLCYRRDDTQHAADRLHERLAQAYGFDRVFMDIDSVPLGVNFVSYISEQLRQCGAVLVIIGPHWTEIADVEGNRRLDDPEDHVRVEIAAALSLGVPVIPLLVQDAPMPRAKDLPENIRALAYQNGMPMPRAYWKESLDRLIKKLEQVLFQAPRRALADKPPKDTIDPLSAIHKLVESRDNRRLLICYPDDAQVWATRVYDRVVAAHGFRAVFHIRDAHAPGPEHYTLDVSATRAAIVLFTPQTLEPAGTKGSDDEFYKTVAALLKAKTPLIPVLVHGAAFPAPALLPEAIRPLATMNAIRLEHTDWALGAKRLLKELRPLMV